LSAETVPIRTVNRQCSSGLQAVADVAAAIKAGFYDIGELTIQSQEELHKHSLGSYHWVHFDIERCVVTSEQVLFLLFAISLRLSVSFAGIGAGIEAMSVNPMAWEGSVNPRVSPLALLRYLKLQP
jgi:acetyl-CoA acyltransferase 1